MNIGEKIKKARKEYGYTQNQLAEEMRKRGFATSQPQIANWENNKDQPRNDALYALADIFDHPVFYFTDHRTLNSYQRYNNLKIRCDQISKNLEELENATYKMRLHDNNYLKSYQYYQDQKEIKDLLKKYKDIMRQLRQTEYEMMLDSVKEGLPLPNEGYPDTIRRCNAIKIKERIQLFDELIKDGKAERYVSESDGNTYLSTPENYNDLEIMKEEWFIAGKNRFFGNNDDILTQYKKWLNDITDDVISCRA